MHPSGGQKLCPECRECRTHQGLSSIVLTCRPLPWGMRLRAPALVAVSVMEVAALAWLAAGGEARTVALEDATRFEGQGDVRLAGLVADVRPAGSDGGSTRLRLQAGPHTLDLWVDGPVHVALGSWVEAQGRIARIGGTPALVVADAADLRVATPPGPLRPAWRDLAADPGAWAGLPLRLEGNVQRGSLHDGDGHRIRLGDGAWPAEGPVVAVGAIAADASCLCHVLHATEVRPAAWTP
jgi:hypothetical protein